jgi:hypothetical protein
MVGPGVYRPDPTEGVTAIADLPPPEIVPSNRTYTRQALIFMPAWYQNLRTKTCSLRLRAFTPGLTPGVLSPISDRH